MAFLFVAASHGESGYGGVCTVKWLVAGTSIQWSYYSYRHSSSHPCLGRVHHSNRKFYVCTTCWCLEKGTFWFHCFTSVSTICGTLELYAFLPIKRICLPQIVIFTVPDFYSTVYVITRKYGALEKPSVSDSYLH